MSSPKKKQKTRYYRSLNCKNIDQPRTNETKRHIKTQSIKHGFFLLFVLKTFKRELVNGANKLGNFYFVF